MPRHCVLLMGGGVLYPHVCGVSVCCFLFEDGQTELRECFARLVFQPMPCFMGTQSRFQFSIAVFKC